MNQGKLIVGIALALGICAGLAGYWWNYRVGHRAIEFWGQENARLIRLAPKVEYLELEFSHPFDGPSPTSIQKTLQTTQGLLLIKNVVDLSNARGLIHLRNAFLSDDQFEWPTFAMAPPDSSDQRGRVDAFRFQDPKTGVATTVLFNTYSKIAYEAKGLELVTLGPLAKSLEQFLARELPRAEQEAAAGTGDKQPEPAKSE